MAAIANRASSSSSATSMDSSQSLHPLLRAANSFPAAEPSGRGRGGIPGGLAARRTKPNFNLRDIDASLVPPPNAAGGALGAGLGAGRPTLDGPGMRKAQAGTPFANFSKIVDPSGKLNFKGKAILHASGVNFSSGASFSINMGQLELMEELGRGNYGTVKKVLHKPTNVEMAMKEIHLELETSKLNAIIMELDILHRASAISPNIVEFYGAFFIESCVYYCMEYMDAGSLDKLAAFPLGDTVVKRSASTGEPELLVWEGVPEHVLAKIAGDMVRGLKFLKDELEVIHRDVKPTNVLVNRRGHIKLCDFGVSGQLEKSLAKTNIGCQSYMAPERIKGESQNNVSTYTVSSDVWSLGLSIIEIGIGTYPYPPETYSNVFAQLTAIVHGDPPTLPNPQYSELARDWVSKCLIKNPDQRASYAELLEHPFIMTAVQREVDLGAWIEKALTFREAKLTAPPLISVASM
ncbi:kinase-like protein [Mycena floridula]|nr:kinase-like protein [Mycena floridula]